MKILKGFFCNFVKKIKNWFIFNQNKGIQVMKWSVECAFVFDFWEKKERVSKRLKPNFLSLLHFPTNQNSTATMISVEESNALFSLLNSEQSSFDEVMSDFNSKFPSCLHFRICTALATLLEVCKRFIFCLIWCDLSLEMILCTNLFTRVIDLRVFGFVVGVFELT